MDDPGAPLMRWRKLGLIFRPDTSKAWMRSHASLPCPILIDRSVYRVYFASRDGQNRSHVGFFDLDLEQPECILGASRVPVLEPGPLGHYDDHGVYAASAVRHSGSVYLYTIGWNPGARKPLFYSSIGLAISDDGGETFRKHGRAPIMARSDHDPCLVTSPMVLKEGDRWRMWYVSGHAWEETEAGLHSRYHIKYAESDDGIHWHRDGTVCIDHADSDERNIGRSCVSREEGIYHAWFSSDRGDGYRLGYARSRDGVKWVRQALSPELEPSGSGWDSRGMAYPFVVRHYDRWFMFYNGNDYGRDGIGLAVCNAGER
jgi:predicted GH43/DUF377 family glycosyl hydrolase